MTQQPLPMPYPPGYCESIKWDPRLWPQHITDRAGGRWRVLHVGGSPTNTHPAQFKCHKPRTVEYHHIKDTEAFPV
jgi:hypothetical protein